MLLDTVRLQGNEGRSLKASIRKPETGGVLTRRICDALGLVAASYSKHRMSMSCKARVVALEASQASSY